VTVKVWNWSQLLELKARVCVPALKIGDELENVIWPFELTRLTTFVPPGSAESRTRIVSPAFAMAVALTTLPGSSDGRVAFVVDDHCRGRVREDLDADVRHLDGGVELDLELRLLARVDVRRDRPRRIELERRRRWRRPRRVPWSTDARDAELRSAEVEVRAERDLVGVRTGRRHGDVADAEQASERPGRRRASHQREGEVSSRRP
jgi:hypothetical protein